MQLQATGRMTLLGICVLLLYFFRLVSRPVCCSPLTGGPAARSWPTARAPGSAAARSGRPASPRLRSRAPGARGRAESRCTRRSTAGRPPAPPTAPRPGASQQAGGDPSDELQVPAVPHCTRPRSRPFARSFSTTCTTPRPGGAVGQQARRLHGAVLHGADAHRTLAKTTEAHYDANPKFVYYLSAEYLLGQAACPRTCCTPARRSWPARRSAVRPELDDLVGSKSSPAWATAVWAGWPPVSSTRWRPWSIPAVGYGIRYEFGIFKQTLRGRLAGGEAGRVAAVRQSLGVSPIGRHGRGGVLGTTPSRTPTTSGAAQCAGFRRNKVLGEPCTTLVPGYGTKTVNILRLWRARATRSSTFELFDVGDYARAVEQKIHSENISKVLYPNDVTPQGKELRLKQQYFFVACSLRDIIRRFRIRNEDWDQLPDKVAIQLNDTHPVVAIPELMRILVDEYELDWDRAWEITRDTLRLHLPHAAARGAGEVAGRPVRQLLPRHLEIIYEINRRFLDEVRAAVPRRRATVSRACRSSRRGRERRCAWPTWPSSAASPSTAWPSCSRGCSGSRPSRDFAELWPERVPEQDQRRDAAPLHAPGQPPPVAS